MPTPETRDAALLPCPFCTGTPRPDRILRDGCKDGEPDAWAYYVRCVQCAAQGPWFKAAGNARRAWNVRLASRTPPAGVVVWVAAQPDHGCGLYVNLSTTPLKLDLGCRLFLGGHELPEGISQTLRDALGLAPGECARVVLTRQDG